MHNEIQNMSYRGKPISGKQKKRREKYPETAELRQKKSKKVWIMKHRQPAFPLAPLFFVYKDRTHFTSICLMK